jgi:hypothetical protein
MSSGETSLIAPRPLIEEICKKYASSSLNFQLFCYAQDNLALFLCLHIGDIGEGRHLWSIGT